MKADIWMPLFIGDYLADTTRLTTEQHGAYLLLIMDYWRNGPPPNDDAVLSNITRSTTANWKKLRGSLSGFFVVADGKWTHSRIDREIEDAQAGKLKAQEKAAKAAEARWSKQSPSNAPSNAPSITQAMHEECPSPSPSPSKLPKSKAETQRATRLPADWLPSDEDITFCKAERPELDPLETGKRFKDYWCGISGQKGRKLDWPATWRNWVRNERSAPAKGAAGGAWWASDAAIMAKGAELGLSPLSGESTQTFKGRIQAAIDNGGKAPVAKSAPIVVIKADPKGQKPDGLVPLKSLIKIREQA